MGCSSVAAARLSVVADLLVTRLVAVGSLLVVRSSSVVDRLLVVV